MKTKRLMSHPSRNRGSTLIMILCLIALVTTAAVAFFGRASTNSVEENVRVTQAGVRQICESGVDHALAGMISWMASNSTPVINDFGVASYFPTNSSLMPPPRFLAQGTMVSDTNFANLTLQSVAAWDAYASSNSSGVASKNGRKISTESWSKPCLLPSGFSSVDQLPCWIYFNKDGSLSASPSTNTIGRFAYNAYDLGGLLDANVAGYPASVGIAQIPLLKGILAGADLTCLPGVTASDVAALISFRNPQATNLTAYTNYLAGAAATGFLNPVTTNASGGGVVTNAFFASRQDLIRYAQSQNTALTNALPYLTHFSRELARPSLPANGLLNMTSRYDLSRVSNVLATGLSGNTPTYSYAGSLASNVTTTNPDLFQVLRAGISYTNSWETNGPTNVFSDVSWPTNANLKAVALGADIIDQFTTNSAPIRITYGSDTETNTVAGKKQKPYVSRVFLVYNTYIQTQSNGNNNNNKNTNNNSSSNTNWMNGKAVGNPGTGNQGNDKNLGNAGNGNTFWITFSVIPQIYTPTGGTVSLTGRLTSGTLSLGGITNIVLPNAATSVTATVASGSTPVYAAGFTGNSAGMGFFGTSYGWQGSISNSTLSVSLDGLSFALDDGSGSVYSAFGTNAAASVGVVSAPMSVSVTLTNISSTTVDTGSLALDGAVIGSADPRTLRGAATTNMMPSGGDTNSLSTNIVVLTNNYAPTLADTNWSASLSRPRSVGDLGYVFRESPWRTIDFSTGPWSADRNLLDLFSAYPTPESGLRAGVVNLNTRQPAVLAALLSGAVTAGTGTITPSLASTYASQMVALTGSTPLTNRTQLVDLVYSNVIASAADISKESREAAVRALGEVGQTRTWNLLLDVVAQSGSFGGATPSPANFMVSGERRVWVSVAIDRISGKIVDLKSEWVGE